MITHLEGRLVEAQPGIVVVDVQGVGYEVLLSTLSYQALPEPGSSVRLLTHLAIREDAHTLYGFMSTEERDLFRLLIQTVSGIGPRIALNVLSAVTPDAFGDAVRTANVSRLSKISGIGKKTAERMVMELKDKLKGPGVGVGRSGTGLPTAVMPPLGLDPVLNDAVMALVQLGRKPAEAEMAVRAAQAMLGPEATVDALVRAGLRRAT
jgi:holliday junction DNA helicase RuvA